ncbi:MAG TPA: 3-isopropylmalate dehydratase small subunit [Candidatus Atribacteria bacterium]|nr:3-isopropylmalate dehydratase small subunit [Candidatus Atribacteria bacterium]
MILKGNVWKYGDNIDTDLIIPARYLNTSDPKELAKHCLEDLDANFANNVKKGDFIVGGKNFGSGSSREHAPVSIKATGVGAVIAKSFARIFYRNAINIGLPIIELKEEDIDSIENKDKLEIDTDEGIVKNLTKGKVYKVSPFPKFLQEIIQLGGLLNYVEKELKERSDV